MLKHSLMRYNPILQNNYSTNRITSIQINEIWSNDLTDYSDHKTSTVTGYRYNLVVGDHFSNYIWTIPLKQNF